MRKDMAKVIVEKPRYNSHAKNPSVINLRKKFRVSKDEDGEYEENFDKRHLPVSLRIGMKSLKLGASSDWYKNLNENLNPLRRFLARRVGQPWDKVYSEVRSHTNPASTTQQHILDQLLDEVWRKVSDGTWSPLISWTYWGVTEPLNGTLYIDDQGVLCKRPKERRVSKKRSAPMRSAVVGKYLFLFIEDNWFRFDAITAEEARAELRRLGDLALSVSDKNEPSMYRSRLDRYSTVDNFYRGFWLTKNYSRIGNLISDAQSIYGSRLLPKYGTKKSATSREIASLPKLVNHSKGR